MALDTVTWPVALIVDDHAPLRQVLREYIGAAFVQLRLREADNVDDALKIVEQDRVALVIMDIHLPGTNGIDGARAILGKSPHSVVVVISNYDDASHRAAASGAGARAFISKRAIHKELILVLRELLNATNSEELAAA